MARLTPEKREDIKSALLLGDSQYKVAQEFEVSSATVNKIFKELDKETLKQTKSLVKEEVAIKTVLSEQSERFSKSFDDKVNDEIRRRGLVFGVIEKALELNQDILKANKTYEKVNVGDGVQQFEPRELNTTDIKNIIEGTDKASITLGVNQRHANSQVQINNTNAQQNNVKTLDDFYEEL